MSRTPTIFTGSIKVLPGGNTALYGDGTIEVSAGPTTNFQVATKKYVDDAIAGLDWKEACNYKTAGPITSTATKSGFQVGKTIINVSPLSVLTIDGVVQAVGNRILVDQTGTAGVTGLTNADNGIYVVNNIGSASSAWVIMRATDADGSPQGEVDQGMSTLIEFGTFSGSVWTLTTPDPVVVDVSPEIFVQSGSGAIPSLTAVLGVGNTTSGRNIIVNNTDRIQGADSTTSPGGLLLRGGNATSSCSKYLIQSYTFFVFWGNLL